jgi:hypothetical protein
VGGGDVDGMDNNGLLNLALYYKRISKGNRGNLRKVLKEVAGIGSISLN